MSKLPSVIFVVFLTIFLTVFAGGIIFKIAYPFPDRINFGVTFSPKYAGNLGLDWQQTYLKIIDELKVRFLRVPTYWDGTEKNYMDFDFSDIDFMLDEARRRGVKVILVLGARQPRWPECHIPSWVKSLSIKDRQEKILEFIGRVVERYKHHSAILAWQVENEPMLEGFGQCEDRADKDFLKQESGLVADLNGKPVVITDSGELGFWIEPMRSSDIFATTVYRMVYDKYLGYVTYPIPPYLYNIKSSLIRYFFAPQNKKTIISELQAEPWSADNALVNMPLDQQLSLFSVNRFRENIEYAKQTGFDTAYLWGVEWWYFMAQNGYPQYLQYAKTLF